MFLDFAPMEGITGAAFRRLHHQYFPGVDRYYTPFLSPTKDHRFTPREQREFFPEVDSGLRVVPQILTKTPEDFLWAAEEFHAMGYEEVNLNMGCPSGTVTAKGKGAGLLRTPEALRCFFDAVFVHQPCAISVKTRLGMEDPEEFLAILQVLNDYPISELIIHPRVRTDFYRHPIRREAFEQALAGSKNPVSFNGGIVTEEDGRQVMERYPQIKSLMVGQALVSDPFLAGALKNKPQPHSVSVLWEFHDQLLDAYAGQFDSRLNATKRMKELWSYLIRLFDGSERHGKRILKAKTVEEYEIAVRAVFQELPLRERSAGGW